MNKCKSCLYGEKFTDMFNGKERYKCGIGQVETDSFGDQWLIIDGECKKWRDGEEEE